jgi:hypothetical protein
VNYQLEGMQVRKLYPKLYYIGAKNTIYNWKNYLFQNFIGLIHSVIIFYVPMWIFNANHQLLANGQNNDLWTMSLVSFTCLYTVVTGKLVIWTRWWTKVSFFFYSIMSICVYILYMWFSNYWPAA